MIYKIVRLSVKPLTADDEPCLFNTDTLTQPIQMQLSQKQKNISEFFFAFLKSIFNSELFPKNDDPHS